MASFPSSFGRGIALAAAAAALACSIAACSFERTSHGHLALTAQPLSATAEEACRQTAAAMCARVETCSRPYVTFVFGDRSECEAQVLDACRSRYDGPGATSTPPTCSAAAKAVPCEELTDPVRAVTTMPLTPGALLLDSCPLVAGRIPAGEPCLRDGDCASGDCRAQGNGCSICEAVGGQPCGDRAEICPAPLVCREGHCSRALGNAGDRCASGKECFSGLCRESACVALRDVGEPCSESAECDMGRAAACDTTKRKCVAFGVAAAGEECTATLSPTVGSTMCAGAASCVAGRCTSRLGEGATCTSGCGLGFTCSSATKRCERRRPTGRVECGP